MKRLPLLMLSLSVVLFSCTNGNKYDVQAADKYENTKVQLAETEQKNPAQFLKASGYDKKNFIRQTVIKGSVQNNAKIVAYKDIELKFQFYSKTGVLLGEDHKTIYETIQPGNTTTFKEKLFAPKDSDSLAIKVLSAKYN
jgi:lipopolysaccharide export LptBFGC system permease protein LptF